MCLIAFAYRAHPDYPLVVAANRDEYYQRPAEPAAFWDDAPAILGGRDLEGMGTWMGMTRGGRFAAVTNFRDPDDARTDARSRGGLVSGFLSAEAGTETCMRAVADDAQAYRGFNLLAFDGDTLAYFTNRGGGPQVLQPGTYGLSNHFLDTPWPKLTKARTRLESAMLPAPAVEPLFDLMADTTLADESSMPKTGLAPERERLLSAARIVSSTYGTRCSTVLLLGRDGNATYAERTYGPEGVEQDTLRFDFRLQG